MAQLIAYIDFYDPRWDSLQAVRKEDLRGWMLNNCKLEHPEECESDEVHDITVDQGEGYILYYSDWGLIEELRLIGLN